MIQRERDIMLAMKVYYLETCDKTVTTVKRNTNNVYISDLHVALSRQTAS